MNKPTNVKDDAGSDGDKQSKYISWTKRTQDFSRWWAGLSLALCLCLAVHQLAQFVEVALVQCWGAGLQDIDGVLADALHRPTS